MASNPRRNGERKLNVKLLLVLVIGTALLGVGVHLLHRTQVRRSARTLIAQADRAQKQDDLVKAEEYLSRYLAYQPNDIDALVRYGEVREEASARSPEARLRASRSIYEKILRREPGRRDIRRRLAGLLMDVADSPAIDPERAINLFTDARPHLVSLLASPVKDAKATDAQKGELTYLLGRCLEGLDQPDEAMAQYIEAKALSPASLQAHVRLANLLRAGPNGASRRDEADRIMDAREVKDGLIAANGQSAPAYLARAAYRTRYQVATDQVPGDLARALELAPDDADVLLAVAEAACGQAEAARGRGDLKQAEDDLARARAHLRHGLDRHPDHVALAQSLAQVEVQADRPSAAVDVLVKAVEASPASLGLRWALTELLITTGQTDAAEESRVELKTRGAPPALLGYLDARIQARKGRWTQAARLLQETYPALAPMSKELEKRALIMLGQCQEALGNLEACQAAYRQAISISLDPDPIWADAHRGLAGALARQNKLDEAIAEYRLIRRDGRAPEIGLDLARLLLLKGLRRPTSDRDWTELDQVLDGLDRLTAHSSEVAILRAEALGARDQPDAARRVLEAARDRNPDQAEIWVALAGLAAAGGKAEAGLAVLDAAQQRLGDLVNLRIARANLWARRGGEPARAALEQLEQDARTLAPKDQARLWHALAQDYLRADAPEQADRLWGRLAKNDPDDLAVRLIQFDRAILASQDDPARAILARVRQIEGEDGVLWRFGSAVLKIQQARRTTPADRSPLAEARTLLESVLERRPNWGRASTALAEVDDLSGDPEGAIKNYLRAIHQLGERNAQSVLRLVQLLYQRQRYNEAALVFQKLQEDRAPISGELQRLAADVSMRTQDFGHALELAEKNVSEQSKDARDLVWLAQVRAAAKQPPEKVEPLLRRAVELAGESPEARVALVFYLASIGRKAEAEAATLEAEARLTGDRAPLALAQCFEVVGRADRAGELYEAALKARPDDLPTLRTAASHSLRSGRVEAGKSQLRRIIDLGGETPDAEWARTNLATITAYRGSHQQLLDALKILNPSGSGTKATDGTASAAIQRTRAKVLASRPNRAHRQEAIEILEDLAGRVAPTADDLFLLAQLHEANGHWTEASQYLLKLLDQHGSNPVYLAYYTLALLRHDRADEARVYLKKLDQLAPKAPGTIALKARVLCAQHKNAEAATLLQDFAQGDEARVGFAARQLEELGLQDEADTMYRTAARSQRPEATLALAAFLGRRGRTTEALDVCDQAWATCPPEAVSNVSVMVLYGAKPDKAHDRRVGDRLDEAIRKHPDTISIQFDLANLRSLEGRYADAEAIYLRLHKRNRTLSGPLNNLAWLLALQGGKEAEALSRINQAIALDGETPDLLDTRAVVHLARNQAKAAARDLIEAIAVSPTSDKYFHLAQAYQREGKSAEAGQAFQKAEELGLTPQILHPLERRAYTRLRGELAQN